MSLVDSGPDPTPAGLSRVYLSVYSPLRLRHATVAGRVVAMNRARRAREERVLDDRRNTVAHHGRRSPRPRGSIEDGAARHGQRVYRLTVLQQPTIAMDPVDVAIRRAA